MGDEQKKKVSDRQPAVAGQFYPMEPEKLKAAIKMFLENAAPQRKEKPVAIIVPHAGYIYSGQIAADAFNQAKGYKYDVIIILGTNHTSGEFGKISVYPDASYITPLGKAEVDTELADEILNSGKDYIYYPAVHKKEHSIEVQIPFIQQIFPKIKIVPIIVGTPDLDLCVDFGKTLGKILKNRNALIVASSDFSHFPSLQDAIKVDAETLNDICSLNPEKIKNGINKRMRRNINQLSTCACGEAPILTAVATVNELKAKHAVIISYANSGQTSIGQNDRVVGYGAVVFTKEQNGENVEIKNMASKAETSFNLEKNQKKMLLEFARQTITQYFKSEITPLPRTDDKVLNKKCGAFVTLNKKGRLRGCIGHMSDDKPLIQVVGSMVLQSAFNDRRFEPLKEQELEEVEIEISVLTPYKEVESEKDIVIGRDGVIIKKGSYSAVYLPQVAPEQGWDVYETLEHLCRKAGLPPNAYKEGTKFYTFQAIVFHEGEGK